jgi:uncharacterized membrane protein
MIMVVMALDHVRDYFSGFKYEPTDLQHAGTIMFFTRWITHFCAPTFIFLSGTSAFLSMGKGKTLRQQSWQLLTRGLWLIVLEMTVVRYGWMFDMDYRLIFLQVIWAIGVSMVVLSALIFLPRQLILTIGLAMIFGHDLMDNFHPSTGMMALWDFLHVQGPITYGQDNTIFIIYPLIPWVGVMAVGFCFGEVFGETKMIRHETLYLIGAITLVLFVLMRVINTYGDPSPWQQQENWWRTLLSMLNCSKYPPSLLYLLMTLGGSVTVLAAFESAEDKRAKRAESEIAEGIAAKFFMVYGKVPLFYYILHIYLVHGLALLGSQLFNGGEAVGPFHHPGYPLWIVYVIWIAVVAILYFPCRWFMRVKQNRRKWWLSYL